MNKNEMTVNNGFEALKDFDLAEAMSSELAGMEVSFDRVSIPAGGGIAFEVPGELPGETDMVKEFTGVILYQHPMYGYYRDKFNGGNSAPDCSSVDGVCGTGNPGGACAACPYNQYGSAENGGKACKNKRRLYILREGELIPIILTLPTGSMKDFGVYVKRLLGKGRKASSVVTRFSLVKAVNNTGVSYSKAAFAVERVLREEELPYITAIGEQVKRFATRVPADTAAATADMTEAPEETLPF